MTISVRSIMRVLLAPQYRLTCSSRLWKQLRIVLSERGDGVRESGAFLLGTRDAKGRAEITHFIPYDDLDPHCLDTGIVRFNGTGYDSLFAICRERKLSVVADIHTHGGAAYLSSADRDHPMIPQAGHLAIIMPGYAMRPVPLASLGFYRYEGAKQWQDWSGPMASKRLRIGW